MAKVEEIIKGELLWKRWIAVRAGNGTQSGDLRARAHPPVRSFKKGGAPPCFSANKEAINAQKIGRG